MFGSVYRNQVFGSFFSKQIQGNCQGTSQYCDNPNAQLPGWLKQLQGNCSSRCMACINGDAAYMEGNKLNKIINTQKKIQRVVGVHESEYISNLTSAVVSNGSRLSQASIPSFGAGTWNQASDRPFPAGSKIKKPKTGSSNRAGIGVDVKHNSYARYLARLKGKNLKVKKVSKTELPPIVTRLNINNPVVNNKPLPLMIVQQAGKTENVCACKVKIK